jgi:hypothetical protein
MTNFIGSSMIVVALLAGGCSSVPAETATQLGSRRPLGTSIITSSIPGFSQTSSTSKFQTGSGLTTVVDSAYSRTSGSNGVFAVRLTNGSAHGILNAGVAFTPYAGGRSAHEALVNAYFAGAGLPTDQVGPIQSGTTGWGSGAAGSPEVPSKYAYTSVISRSLSGIRVAESHAWARLDSSGGVVAEGIYWPTLDASVVADALALAATLANPTTSVGYIASLPIPASVASTGSVVIHHTSEFVDAPVQAVACYDVWNASPAGSGWTRHFDKTGTEVRLPQESRSSVSSTKKL